MGNTRWQSYITVAIVTGLAGFVGWALWLPAGLVLWSVAVTFLLAGLIGSTIESQ